MALGMLHVRTPSEHGVDDVGYSRERYEALSGRDTGGYEAKEVKVSLSAAHPPVVLGRFICRISQYRWKVRK